MPVRPLNLPQRDAIIGDPMLWETLRGLGQTLQRIADETGVSDQVTYDPATGTLTLPNLRVTQKVILGSGTFGLEGMFNAAIRSDSNALEAVLGSSAAPDTTGASTAIFEKYCGADITTVSNATVSILTKKIGGTGVASARVSGIQSDAVDVIGWSGVGAQSFAEGGHFRGTAAWPAGKQGSVQGVVADAQVQAPATDFGFINAAELAVYNYVADKTFRSVATLDGLWPPDMSVAGIAQSLGTEPIDIGLSIGNGYVPALSDPGIYHGLYIRYDAIKTGGNLISSKVFTVTKTGRLGVGTTLPNTTLDVEAVTATTNAVVSESMRVLTSSGTPAAGLGWGDSVWLADSGGTARQASGDNTLWAVATAGSYKGQRDLYALDAGGARLCFSIAASGAAPMVGFYATAPVVKQNVTGAKGGNAALASLMTALAATGLVTDSTT